MNVDYREKWRLRTFQLAFYAVICSVAANQAFAQGARDSSITVSFRFRARLPGGVFIANSDRWYPAVFEAVTKTKARLDSALGDVAPVDYDLIVADTEELFASLVGDGFPDWGGAVAIPSQNRIVLRSPEISRAGKPLAALAAHEYSHLAVHSAMGGRAAPRWLDEGLAMYIAGEWSYQDFIAITIASWRGKFVPFSRMRRLNTFDEKTAQLAYAESYLAIKYLIDYYGVGTLREIVTLLASGETPDAALMQTIGVDQEGFQEELILDIRQRFSLINILMESTIFWGALALLVVIGYILAQRRKKKRYAMWEEREKYESTDFDYGDPEHPEQIDDEDEPWK